MTFLQAEPAWFKKTFDAQGVPTGWIIAVKIFDDGTGEDFKYREYHVTGPQFDNIITIPNLPGRKAALRALLRSLILQDYDNWITNELPNLPQPTVELSEAELDDYLGVIT